MLFRRTGQLSVTITYKNRGFVAQDVRKFFIRICLYGSMPLKIPVK